ncbi:hypothetical protein pdam_00025705, partial [Pocillopora damicornis]
MVTKTTGTKIASDGFKERVFEPSLADLQNDEVAFSKFKLIVEDIQDAPGQDIERACQSIYPLHDVFIRKFK